MKYNNKKIHVLKCGVRLTVWSRALQGFYARSKVVGSSIPGVLI